MQNNWQFFLWSFPIWFIRERVDCVPLLPWQSVGSQDDINNDDNDVSNDVNASLLTAASVIDDYLSFWLWLEDPCSRARADFLGNLTLFLRRIIRQLNSLFIRDRGLCYNQSLNVSAARPMNFENRHTSEKNCGIVTAQAYVVTKFF